MDAKKTKRGETEKNNDFFIGQRRHLSGLKDLKLGIFKIIPESRICDPLAFLGKTDYFVAATDSA